MENKGTQLKYIITALEKLASAITWVEPNYTAAVDRYLGEAWDAIDDLRKSKETE